MKKRHLFLAMALPAVFAACTQDDFVSENTQGSAQQGKLITLPDNFVAISSNGAQTKGMWETNTNGTGKFIWMPTLTDSNNDGVIDSSDDVYTPDRIGYSWTGVNHKEDGTLDEVGSALTDYSDRVFTNYEFIHFAWAVEGKDAAQDICDGTWEPGTITLLQNDYFDANWKRTTTALPAYDEDGVAKGKTDVTTGLFETCNSTVYAGDYIVYAPYDNENVSNYIVASSKKVFKGDLFSKTTLSNVNAAGDIWKYNDIFIYGVSQLNEGGVQTTTFETKNLNGYVMLDLKGSGNIKKVILYDAKGRLMTKVGLSAKAIMENKEGKDLYLADGVVKRETTTTISVEMEKSGATPAYPALSNASNGNKYVLIPVLPTEAALDGVEVILINEENKAVRKTISLSVNANAFTNVAWTGINFANAPVLVTDEAALRYETGNQPSKDGVVKGFDNPTTESGVIPASDKMKTVELLGDIELTTTLAIRDNYTLTGGRIIIPGNDGENVSGYGNKAELRMVVHGKGTDAKFHPIINSDILVKAAGCCKEFGGSLIVGNATINGDIVTEDQTEYEGFEKYVDGLSADKSKHGMVKFNVTGAYTTFNGSLVNNGRLDFGRSDRGAGDGAAAAQLTVEVDKGSIVNNNIMTIFRYIEGSSNDSQYSAYVYVGQNGTMSNNGEFTIEGKWAMLGAGQNSGTINDRVSSTVSGTLLNYNTADAEYICDVNDNGIRFKDAVDGKSKPTTTVRFVEEEETYDFETVTEESTAKKIREYIIAVDATETVTLKGDIKLSGKDIIVESGNLKFAKYDADKKASTADVASKLSVENLIVEKGTTATIENVAATINKQLEVNGVVTVAKDVQNLVIGKSGALEGTLLVSKDGEMTCNLNSVTTVYGNITNNGMVNIIEATATTSDIPAYLYYTGSLTAGASNWAQGVASKI